METLMNLFEDLGDFLANLALTGLSHTDERQDEQGRSFAGKLEECGFQEFSAALSSLCCQTDAEERAELYSLCCFFCETVRARLYLTGQTETAAEEET